MAARKSSLNDIVGLLATRVVWTILGILSGVILARKLGPVDRGILALVLMVPNTAMTFVKLGITQANVYFINRKGVAIEKVASNSLVLALTLGMSVGIIIWIIKDGLLTTVLSNMPAWALALCLIRIPMRLLDDFLYGVLQAVGAFRIYNVRLLVSEFLRLVAVVVCLVFLGQGLFAAVLIHTLINLFNIIWLVITTRREVPFGFRLDRPLLAEQLEFGLKSWVQTLTAHGLLRADIYMVSSFLGPAPTAFYALALHLTETVLEIPQAIGLVLYPRLASLPKAEAHRLTAQTCRRTVLLTGLCAVAISLFGPYIITLWYGPDYAPAGAPLPWASVGAIGMTIYVILTRDFTSQGRQAVNIAAGVPALLINLALNFYLIPTMGIVGAAVATGVAYMIACIILLTFYVPWAGVSLRDVLVPRAEDFRYFWETAWRLIGRLPLVGRTQSAGR